MPNFTTLLCLAFPVLVWWPLWRKWKSAVWWGALWSVVFLGVGTGVIPQWFASQLQSADYLLPPTRYGAHTAIILLGGGNARSFAAGEIEPGALGYSRIEKTAALYFAAKRQHAECTIFVSGGDADRLGKSEAEIYAAHLRQLGVAADDLQLETESRNTYENAKFIQPLLGRRLYDTTLLVTSGLHLKRALLYFKNFDLHPTPVASDVIRAPRVPLLLGFNFTVADLVWHEYLGIARLHLYNFFGLN